MVQRTAYRGSKTEERVWSLSTVLRQRRQASCLHGLARQDFQSRLIPRGMTSNLRMFKVEPASITQYSLPIKPTVARTLLWSTLQMKNNFRLSHLRQLLTLYAILR